MSYGIGATGLELQIKQPATVISEYAYREGLRCRFS